MPGAEKHIQVSVLDPPPDGGSLNTLKKIELGTSSVLKALINKTVKYYSHCKMLDER